MIVQQQQPGRFSVGGARSFFHNQMQPSQRMLSDGNKAINQDRSFYLCCGTLCMIFSPLTLCATIAVWPCMICLGLKSCTYTQDSRKSVLCIGCCSLCFLGIPLLIWAIVIAAMVAGQPPTCWHSQRSRCVDCIPNITEETMVENRESGSAGNVHAQWVFPFLDRGNPNWRWITNSWGRGTEVERRNFTDVAAPNWQFVDNVEESMINRHFVEDDEAGLFWPEESRESCLHGPGKLNPDTMNIYSVSGSQSIVHMPESTRWTTLGTHMMNDPEDEDFPDRKYPLSLSQADVSSSSAHMNALLQPAGTLTGSVAAPDPDDMYSFGATQTTMLWPGYWSPSANGGDSDKRSTNWHLNEWYAHYFFQTLPTGREDKEERFKEVEHTTSQEALAYRVPYKSQDNRNLLDLTQEREDREGGQYEDPADGERHDELYPPEYEFLCRESADFSGLVQHDEDGYMQYVAQGMDTFQPPEMNTDEGDSEYGWVPSCQRLCNDCLSGSYVDLRGLAVAVIVWSCIFFILNVLLCCKYGYSYNLATRAEYEGKQRARVANAQNQAWQAQQQNNAMAMQMQMQQMQMQQMQMQQPQTIVVNNNMVGQPQMVLPGQAVPIGQQLQMVKQ